jgi:hypothetical protein
VDKAVTDSMNSFNFRSIIFSFIRSFTSPRHAVMAAYPKELTTDIPEHRWTTSPPTPALQLP